MIAVTGAGSGAGAAVLAHLAGSPRVARTVGIDDGPRPPGATAEWHQVDGLDPGLTAAFAGVTAVAHCAVDLTPDPDRDGQRQRNTRAAQTAITAAFAAGVRRVVVLSSALVYGAYADNPVPLDDDAPLRAMPESSAVGDLLEIERIAAGSRRSHRGLAVTVLRPAVVLGAGDREPMAALLSAPRLLRIRGADTRWQFCHVSDLAAAVELAALAPAGVLDGPANVACDGWLDHDELERVSG
ncbi:MAG TPA: NAD-dependent epimerase/dehydratase family protein, partial [Mycobacteriales bacterium]|nr:NAD-dependent epimerase/dehydratase family protein [Mycobacteriales bacterium]